MFLKQFRPTGESTHNLQTITIPINGQSFQYYKTEDACNVYNIPSWILRETANEFFPNDAYIRLAGDLYWHKAFMDQVAHLMRDLPWSERDQFRVRVARVWDHILQGKVYDHAAYTAAQQHDQSSADDQDE